eukprot:1337421-Prymnesium_polylepis.1
MDGGVGLIVGFGRAHRSTAAQRCGDGRPRSTTVRRISARFLAASCGLVLAGPPPIFVALLAALAPLLSDGQKTTTKRPAEQVV